MLKLNQELRHLFKEISEFYPLTDFICPTCQFALEKYKEFKTEIQFKHAKIRNDAFKAVKEEVFNCTYCPFSCNNGAELLKHTEDNHSFYCEFCSFHCRAPLDLANHIRLLHKEKDIVIIIDDIFYCQYCSKSFTNQTDYEVHVSIHKNIVVKEECELNIESKMEVDGLPSEDPPNSFQITSVIGGAIVDYQELAKKPKKKITPQRPTTLMIEAVEVEKETEKVVATKTPKNLLEHKKKALQETQPFTPIEVIKKIKPNSLKKLH